MSLEQYAPLIIEEAKRQGVDPALALAIAENESQFDPKAKSPMGAVGIFQLMPSAAKDMGIQPKDRFDPVKNIKAGIGYFKNQLSAANGDYETALAMYNRGRGNFYSNKPEPQETKNYKRDILGKGKPKFDAYLQFAKNDTGTMTDADPFAEFVNTPETEADPFAEFVNDNSQQSPPQAPIEQAQVEQSPQDGIGANVVKSMINTAPESLQDAAAGIIEPVASIGSGLAASAYGGLKGWLFPGQDNGVSQIEQAQQEYTYQPRTPTGMINTSAISSGFGTAGKVISAPFALGGAIEKGINTGDLGLAKEKYAQLQESGLREMLGNRAQDLGASPLGAAAAYTLPDIIASASGVLGKARPVADNAPRINQLAGRVSQGVKEDIAPTIKTIQMYTPEEVASIQTYDDMSKVLTNKLSETGMKQDAILESNPTKYRLPALNKTVGKTPVNYVLKMLNNMKDYYASTTNLEKLDVITNLKNKALTEGLTAKEINNLARMNTTDMSAYNANGQLSNGITKQSNENIRRGVKNTVDQLVDNKEFKALDKDFEAIFNTRDLAQKNYDAFLKTKNKIKDAAFLEKYGYKIVNIADRLSGQLASGGVRALLPKGQGIHTNTAHGMGVDLSKNLNELYDLLNQDLPPKVLAARLDKMAYNSGKALAATGVTSSGDRNVIKITKFKEEK